MTLIGQTVHVWLTPEGAERLHGLNVATTFQALVREVDSIGVWVHRWQDQRWLVPLFLLRRDFVATMVADWQPDRPEPLRVPGAIGFAHGAKKRISRK